MHSLDRFSIYTQKEIQKTLGIKKVNSSKQKYTLHNESLIETKLFAV